MSRPLPIFLLLLACCLVVGGCPRVENDKPRYDPPASLPAVAPQPAVTAANVFGFSLFHKLTAGEPENVFISPTSLMLALAMTYNGARGETKAEMAKALHVSGIPDGDLNQQLSDLQKALRRPDKKVWVEIANSLWADRGNSFKTDFVRQCRHFYDATLRSLDFHSPGAANAVNSWAAKHTHGLIREIVTPSMLQGANLLLADAVYFKGEWSNFFKERDTEPADFTLSTGQNRTVHMMERHGQYIYAENNYVQAIALPYGTGRVNMIVVLPRSKQGLPTLLKAVDDKAWQALLGKMAKREGTIKLPRFESVYEADLGEALKALGMGALLYNPDLGAMTDGATPQTAIKHKTYLRVTERKTEAAAVTSVITAASVLPPDTRPFEMTVDHPFLLGIIDTQTGATLFLGAIVDPQETRAGE